MINLFAKLWITTNNTFPIQLLKIPHKKRNMNNFVSENNRWEKVRDNISSVRRYYKYGFEYWVPDNYLFN